MKNKNSKKLTVAIITLLLILIILVTGYYSYKAAESATIKEFNKRQLILAENAGNSIELYFETIANNMKAFGETVEEEKPNEEKYRKMQHRRFKELEQIGVNDIGWLNKSGTLLYNEVAHQIQGIDFSWRKYFTEAKQMDPDKSYHTYVIEFIDFKGVEKDKKGVLLSVPLFTTDGKKEFDGVLVSTLKLNTVTKKFIENLQSSENSRAFLLDDEKHLLWEPSKAFLEENPEEIEKTSQNFKPIINQMEIGTLGTLEYSYYKLDEKGKYTNQKETKLMAYHPIKIGKELWTIGIWAPKQEAKQLISAVYFRQLLLIVLIIIILILGALYITTHEYI